MKSRRATPAQKKVLSALAAGDTSAWYACSGPTGYVLRWETGWVYIPVEADAYGENRVQGEPQLTAMGRRALA